MSLLKLVSLLGYYCFARYLPSSYNPVVGKLCNKIRIVCVRHAFKRCGKISTMDRMAYFGTGADIEIGDFSGIGERCIVPKNTVIGKYVMMAPEVYIIGNNHITADVNTPMCFQGKTDDRVTIIEDDVWLGARVMIMPGRRVGKGSVLAAGAVVTKDVPPFCIFGGNPAKVIRRRDVGYGSKKDY